MKLLLNSTKTMDATVAPPRGYRTTRPAFESRASELIAGLRRLSALQLRKQMGVSERLAETARGELHLWGEKGTSSAAALFAFTGLVYKYVDAPTLSEEALRRAGRQLLILSGLYGLLRTSDRISNYRLEMGSRWAPGSARSLVAWWKEDLTAAVNQRLRKGEPLLNLAAQEYLKALDLNKVKGPVISPVFKERRPDGSLKTAPVHAKMARGALVRWCLENWIEEPAGLLAFGELGWEAENEPPESGVWLFSRPVRE